MLISSLESSVCDLRTELETEMLLKQATIEKVDELNNQISCLKEACAKMDEIVQQFELQQVWIFQVLNFTNLPPCRSL